MNSSSDVVVGFDGAVTGGCAVDWAAQEADSRGAGLRIVTVMPYADLTFGGIGAGTVSPVDRSELAGTLLAGGQVRAAKVLDESRITTRTAWGHPAAALVDESRDAALVVVGHPERGKAREYVTGSVAFAVAAHAECDVAVVPRGDLKVPGPDLPVVVGADGSSNGETAARRAAEAAVRWGAPLEIVQAWQPPSLTGWSGVGSTVPLPDEVDYVEKSARASVAATEATIRTAYPGLEVRTKVVEGHPVVALLDAAETAGLLVVGTRGLGGFKRLILGSVSRAVIHYAETPVLVVRS